MAEQIKNNSRVEDDEIDLIALAKTIWDGRRIIIRTVLIFMIIGLLIALFSPKEYTASSTMVPQLSSSKSKLGGLSSLAAMAGFNLDMNMETSELSPYIYPQIVQSVPFQLELMETPFKVKGIDKPISIYEYYTENYAGINIISAAKKYTIGLPGVILRALKSKQPEEEPAVSGDSIFASPISLTTDQESIRKMLSERVTLETNDKEGYVVLNAIAHDPKLAAQVAHKAQSLLQKYITEFKIKKANAQLAFIEERYAEKRKDFEKAQANLAAFRDRNKNVTSAVARTEEERLQSDYQLAFEVYSQLAQQLEQAQIKVKEDTPVFSIVKPVTVPVEKSKPNRPLILIIWTFLGGIIGVGWIFGKQFIQTIKVKWNEPL
ncbi:MAG TPA: Wzz/FepE/Etk N-terminal domain-containing protein [Draconibacterium sp.]|nr:Wzz/FepE/Etk N-terminal domain-containing protein [Draconibacterium sp.]